MTDFGIEAKICLDYPGCKCFLSFIYCHKMKTKRLKIFPMWEKQSPPDRTFFTEKSHSAEWLRQSRWLTLICLLMFSTYSKADDMNSGMISFSGTDLQTSGYVTVTVPVYDDHNEDEWVVTGLIKINNFDVVRVNTAKQGEASWYWSEAYAIPGKSARVKTYETYDESTGSSSSNWRDITGNNDGIRYNYTKEGSTTKATFRIYPTVEMLKTGNINMVVDIEYDGNGASGGDFSKSSSVTYTLPSAPSLSWSFGNPGFQSVAFQGTAGDKYKITDNTTQKEIQNNGVISVDYAVLNVNRKVDLTYYKKISTYQLVDVSTSILIPAYQHPTNFKAVMNAEGNVDLTWSISSISGESVAGDNFEVQRSETESFSAPVSKGTVTFDGSGSYSLRDNTSKDNLNGTYYYRLRRTKAAAWQWNYVKSTSVLLSMKHRFINNAAAGMVDNSNVQITWNYDAGNIWSENSDIVLVRTNEMKGTSETYAIPRDSIAKRRYTEKLLTTCDVYSYKIYIKPGNTVYPSQEALKVTSSKQLYTVEMGQVVSLIASKGYYSDQVELEWTTDGKPVNVFSIRAREYNSNGEFKQIDQVNGNVASSNYQYSDKKSIPGIIYEYQIVSIASCGDENRMIESQPTIGFRTPTGDIYGRVTFKNGQAVKDVEVRAEVSDGSGITGRSYNFDGTGSLMVDNAELLKSATKAVTLEAWIKPVKEGTIIEKPGMYKLVYDGGKIKFTVGTQKVETDSKLSAYTKEAPFVHVTAVASEDSIFIYLNDRREAVTTRKEPTVSGTDDKIIMGTDGFEGNLDEVRLWTVARDSMSIARDHSRYLIGNETGLSGYYTFDYSVDSSFYDLSYRGSKYNQNHGTVTGATIDNVNIPTINQLGYKGYTQADGSYTIRAVPYIGNGTAYMIIPRMGIHAFESEKELRLLGANSQNHTVNFTDKSSFEVSGTVAYKNGTVPVADVSFTVDGVTVMDGKANIVKTNAAGQFTINVPVGTHEVKAVLQNHVFENGGKITNSDGTDRNYQDKISGLELQDVTTIRYIGRVAGGSIQEAYPVGHSLSKNNLADGITVKLIYQNDAYKMTANDSTVTMNHFKAVTMDKQYSNNVDFSLNTITIYPNPETGEFVANVRPEKYKVEVVVPGHQSETISGNNSEVNLINVFALQNSVNEYQQKGVAYSDTVKYNQQQLFIKRYTPQARVKQLDSTGKAMDFFGNESIEVADILPSDAYKVKLYDETSKLYTLGTPVFEQAKMMKFAIDVFEKYVYMNADGSVKADVAADDVPTQDAIIKFGGDLPYGAIETREEIEVDSLGHAVYSFQVNNPELTSAKRSISATIKYDGGNTSIDWADKFEAVILGARQRGTSFITAGPDKVMFVLRDPPGSNSYSYLEKGATVTETNTYIGSGFNTGDGNVVTKGGPKVITFAGLGGGTITENEIRNELGIGWKHEETVTGTVSNQTATTTTTRFQTSADPEYVGTNGDLYVGYSTNLSYGATDNVTVISKKDYDAAPQTYTLYSQVTPTNQPWLLVQSTGLGIAQQYGTLFAYPQIHIERVLIPEMKNYRNNILHQAAEMGEEQFKQLAETTKQPVYVSKLAATDPNFGKSNSDNVFSGTATTVDPFDGPSYKIYYPSTIIEQKDTILTMNQSIGNWEKLMRANEEEKVKAELIQNYSYQAGAGVEMSESFSTLKSNQTSFQIVIGATVASSIGVMFNGAGGIVNINEEVGTSQGGEFTSGEEANHAQGFVLQDSGEDYLSVDVCRQSGYSKDDEFIDYDNITDEPQFSTFIFKTKAGTTTCPYEPGYSTKYFEPGQHIIDEPTRKGEVPEISVEKDFIDHVPSGEYAYATLYIRNNSESQDDKWYDLKLVDGTNPNGATLVMDGAPIGNGRALLVPAGETLVKTLTIGKGKVLNYDGLQLQLMSQCQCDPTGYTPVIADTVTINVHFTPSCTDVKIKAPANNWTYNTKLPTDEVNGVKKHYMNVSLNGFDVNYDNFYSIRLQYKPTSGSDNDWVTLMNYYNDKDLYDQAVVNGQTASMIEPDNTGALNYRWFLDDLQDQHYDLRAVSICMINNAEVENISEVHTGVKDMYTPRLFGSAQPANGILTINNEIRLNFNEKIAEGYLTNNNFEVTGVRNGAQTDHSVAVRLDGDNDCLTSEFDRNWSDKNLTVEMWVLADKPQDAVFFSHGDINEAMEFGITADNHLKVKVGSTEIISNNAVVYEQDNWAHVAMVFEKEGKVSAYYNFVEYISKAETGIYEGEGRYVLAASVNGGKHFSGKMHNTRIWDKVLTSGRIQTNSLNLLSGAESNLLAYYPMNEAKGNVLNDKARGANLEMNGSEWALPEGRSAVFNGADQYVRMNTGSSAVIDNSMDYTVEFWFRGEAGQANATLVSNGRGDGQDMGGSKNLFSIGFDEGVLTYHNNEAKATVDGDYLDNNWHHLALAVSRTNGRAQILIDGVLKSYFEAQDLGGVAAAYTYLGARGWTSKEDATTIKVDNFFKGEIDEFRIWNLYKSETLVANCNSEHLDGTEKGLLAYYPFEHYIDWQGTKELQFTLKDLKVQSDLTQTVADAIAFGGNVETAAAAPVKDKGPVSKLVYDFVVNNDALIITLNEAWDRIEKTIVTFTVDGVRDINGNEIQNPVMWSAYIDRNQLKWGDKELTIEKGVDVEKSFTVKAVNNGGAIQHFTIENMPSWLTVTPENGTIAPSSSQDIKFTIDAALNIGSYDEVIYMRNDNNVLEALPLKVKVRGEKPDWKAEPADYKYNMSVFGKLLVNNIYSMDEEDLLAVFQKGTCIGVAKNLYSKANDMYYALLSVYSNSVQASDLEFRIWDASTGTIYQAVPDRVINFANNAVVGTAITPVIFAAKDIHVQHVALKTGWNWASFNITNNTLDNLDAILANNTWTKDDVVKNEQGGFASYSSKGWVGSLTGFNNESMFIVRSSSNQVLNITGAVVDPRNVRLPIIGSKPEGTPRWNYISYLPVVNLTLKEALAGYDAVEGDIIKSQSGFAMYSGNLGWIGNLTYMESGKGYMLQRNASTQATLQYPKTSAVGSRAAATRAMASENSGFVNADYANTMTIVAKPIGVEVSDGDCLLAYVDGECRGKATMFRNSETGDDLFFLSVAGDKEERVSLVLESHGKVAASSESVFTYSTNSSRGNIAQPMLIDFTDKTGKVAVYPSVFSDVLYIQMNVESNAIVGITINDVQGRIIENFTSCNQNGVVNIAWKNATQQTSGVYFVNILVDGNKSVYKVIKK